MMKQELYNDLQGTSRKHQRIAEGYYKWAYSCNNWKACTDIYDAYKNPSRRKVVAFNRCKDLCEQLGGFDFRITAAGCQTFSVCFKYWGKETGALCFAYITRDYDRFCFVNEAA